MLAEAIAGDPQIGSHFSGGVYWEREALAASDRTASSPKLLIQEGAAPINVDLNRGDATLFTTRASFVPVAGATHSVDVSRLTTDQGVKLVSLRLDTVAHSASAELVEAADHLAFPIALGASVIRELGSAKATWSMCIDSLKRSGGQPIDLIHASADLLLRTMLGSERWRYAELVQRAKDGPLTESSAADLWKTSSSNVRLFLNELRSRGLVWVDDRGYLRVPEAWTSPASAS